MTWLEAVKIIKTGICREETAGTAETAPASYCYLSNEGVLNAPREQDELRQQGARSLTCTVGKPYHVTASLQSWIFPEDNCFGELLYGALGNESSAKHGTSSYMHTFSISDTYIPSFTVWAKTGVYEAKATNCQVSQLTINNAKASVADFTADIVGSSLATCTDFGTASYVSCGTKVFRSGNGKLIYDDALVANIDDVNLVINNNVDPADAKSFGVDYAQHLLAGNREISGSLTAFVEDTTMLADYWGSTTGPTLNQETIPLEFVWESSTIDANAEVSTVVKRSGSATSVLTIAGTYDDDPTTSFLEFKITTVDSTNGDKFKWRQDYGAWSAEVVAATSAITMTGEGGNTVAFSATTGHTTADRWCCYVGDLPYALRVELPAVKIESFDQQSTGNRLSAKINFKAQNSNVYGYDIKAFLLNTHAASYSAQ